MPVPDKILDLVERFRDNRADYMSAPYKEARLRQEFIDPFFRELGWDMDNEQNYAEQYKDVIHEESIKIGNNPEAPDYCFRIGGTRKFFLEAKKPSINIKDDASPAYQLRRYAWSAKLPLSILTDFEEFAWYDCRVKPVKTDGPAAARLRYLTFDQYPEAWDEIAGIFSREAILKGSFDRYAATTRGKKGTAEVDTAFLTEIESWRDELARNIALRNTLSRRDLNFAVQRTIDRIIFLRICEDRSIEDYQTLHALLNGKNIYPRLKEMFYRADQRYNSGLFHFSHEKNEAEAPDDLTPRLVIDDKPLANIIKCLYYPDSPYEFSVLPADILGQVYEQFLGKVIRLTEGGHQAKVEYKPEVKKAGGVFYTPTYIVEYIVEHTVGKLLEGITPAEASNLRILDPACGSGSFLIGAYQYLLDWHLTWYMEHDPEKWCKGREPRLFLKSERDWRLTTGERKRILLNSIYGVDIDTQAVEVTKLSLLLKVLEGETKQSIDNQTRLFHARALPDLGANIKCGNSLIGPDFYAGQYTGDLFDEEERYRINVFDWEDEFPEIIKAGGFDAVIGNPPYVRQEMLGEFKEYFQRKYKVYHGVADLYSYFIEKGVSLLREGGVFSYIVANKWMRANYGEPLRRWLRQVHVEEIVDFGDLPVFQNATTYPCIIRIIKEPPAGEFRALEILSLVRLDLNTEVENNGRPVSMQLLSDKGWSLATDRVKQLLEKLASKGRPLGEYVEGKIYRGILTGLNEAFVIDEATRERLIKEDAASAEIIKPFLAGRDVKRYMPPMNDKYLLLIPNGWTRARSDGTDPWNWFRTHYPAVAAHLNHFKEKATKRWDKGDFWWELRSCDYYGEFEKPKIMFPDLSIKGDFTIDKTGGIYSANTTYILCSAENLLLGILNSTLFSFIYKNLSSSYRGGYLRFFTQYMHQIPIRTIDFSSPADVARHDRMVTLVTAMLDLHKQLAAANTAHDKTAIQRLIDATDSQIDALVYELYGLTDEEIGIVEGR